MFYYIYDIYACAELIKLFLNATNVFELFKLRDPNRTLLNDFPGTQGN